MKIFLVVLLLLLNLDLMAQIKRSEVDEQNTWNLADIYENVEAWDAKKKDVESRMQKVVEFKGKLGRSAKDLLAYFDYKYDLQKEISRLSVYAGMKSDEDLGDADNIARTKALDISLTEYSQLGSFASAELAAIPKETVERFLAEEPGLEKYRMVLDKIERQKMHVLSDAEEALLAKTSILGNVPEDSYSILSNAELPWRAVTLSDGRTVEMDQAAFCDVRASAVREDRELVFNAFLGTYKAFEGTIGEMMNGNIREYLFHAKARNYESTLDAALYGNNIPTSVYHSLIENVNKNLPTFHRYLNLKKRMMGLDTLSYFDLYAPAVEDVELKYSYEEAKALVLEAIEPLGEDYRKNFERAFAERWIDIYPNKGKRSGAYMNGSAYDVHPYVLLNYNDSYESVGTLIHEMGHAMHSFYSNKTQDYVNSRYVIFVAEVASTFNEALLDDLMRKKLQTKGEKLSLLMSMLDGYKGTLFRQTQFAEFELRMHEMAEAGKPITGKELTKLYGEIVRKYYGHDLGVCRVDDIIANEWEFIHHFYYGFYVYQYSTSFVASQALAAKVLSGDKEARDRYLHFLTTGCSKYPVDILKDAGVDMTSSEPFDEAIARMNELMDEIEELLKSEK